jgi:hypothetical protein
MRENKHRWKKWIDERNVELLEEAARCLSEAWAADSRDPEHYPLESSYIVGQVKAMLRNDPSRKNPIIAKRTKPQRFADLFSEEDIKFVFEDHNSGSYEDALVAVWEDQGVKSRAALRKIFRAIEKVYLWTYGGLELLPAPRVHFLHRRLLDIVNLAGMSEQTPEGIAEFLDDVCPCGKKHTDQAIRKLKKRLP